MSFTFFFQLVQMLQKRSLIVIIFLSLYLTSRMIVKVFRRTVCPQIRVGSCFRSMTLVVNDAMVAIGKKNKHQYIRRELPYKKDGAASPISYGFTIAVLVYLLCYWAKKHI